MSEPIEYSVALEWAERNQKKLAMTIPDGLKSREDRFLKQMRKAKTGPIKRLEVLYALMDELSEAMAPLTPCKKGCSSCCHYNVSVSEVEISYIEKKTKHRRLKNYAAKQNFHGQPCPFLRDGVCSIYLSRPFVCRRHNALTPNDYWCHHERSDQPFPLVAFTNVDQVFDEIRLSSNGGEPHDIRQVFGSAAGA